MSNFKFLYQFFFAFLYIFSITLFKFRIEYVNKKKSVL